MGIGEAFEKLAQRCVVEVPVTVEHVEDGVRAFRTFTSALGVSMVHRLFQVALDMVCRVR